MNTILHPTLISYLILIFFNLVFGHTLSAQTKVDTLAASVYYKKADSLLTERKLDSSIVYFKKALPLYQQAKSWEKVASCYNKVSENLWRDAKYKKSLINANKALAICKKHLNKDHIEEANVHCNLGQFYLRNNVDYGSSLFHHEKALGIKKKQKNKDKERIILTYNNIATIYSIKGKFDIANKKIRTALKIGLDAYGLYHNSNSTTYAFLALLYSRMGLYNEAINFHKKSIHIRKKIHGEHNNSMAIFYGNMASNYRKLNSYEEAIFFAKKSISIRKKLNQGEHPDITLNYNTLGISYKLQGEYDKALQYYYKGLRIGSNSNNQKNDWKATFYSNIGVIFKHQKEYDKALIHYNKALDFSINIHGENHPRTARVYNNIAYIYIQQHKFENALNYIYKSLNIREKFFKNGHPDLAENYNYLGDTHFIKKEYTQAIKNYEKAKNTLKTFLPAKHPEVIQSVNYIANAYFKQQEYQKALAYYNQAITNNTKEKSDTFFDPNIALTSLEGAAKTHTQLYQNDKDANHLNNAISTYQKADMLIGTIRQTLTNYQDKVTFAQKAKEVYHGAITAQLLQKDQKSLAQAFAYAEKSKANTLKELLRDANAKNYTGLPTDLLTLEKELRANRAFYQSAITKQQSKSTLDTAKIRAYESRLFDVNRQQDSLITVLEKEYPKYYQLKHENNITSAIDIQTKLKDRTTLLEFFTTDSITYAFMVSKNKVSAHELATSNLTDHVEALRNSIVSKNTKAYKTIAHQLYQQLLSPLQHQLTGNELIIVPDGPLWHLNFELLLTQNDPSNNPVDFSYLLRDYVISYANAANVLFANPYRDSVDTKKQECLAFSFSDSTLSTQTNTMSMAALRGTNDDLPGTRKEIKAIADIINGQYYYGANAIEANFKKNANQYNILHLALHGEVDHERPENSRLFFTKNKDTIEDNLLYSHELFALDIPAELTVLSACNTGSGKIATGEGIMSLGSAFQYAGTKSLLLSSWDVSDQTTPQLMKYFYTNLKKGMNKAKALQQAKLQYLQTANINRTQPFYWGGFYLVGDPAPIPFENTTVWYWILGIGVLILVIRIGFWYRSSTGSE
ncbi:CHAT domain-containing protein [Aquimarina sp. AU474]|uniref:CHAT domain-containing protein n=1 Tax=Aquimarina sp. AU474 TaxID=2108529 RepID=UPI000D69D0A2|nr:CHAT domain-containing protein [Aquimarina sp. AU474]